MNRHLVSPVLAALTSLGLIACAGDAGEPEEVRSASLAAVGDTVVKTWTLAGVPDHDQRRNILYNKQMLPAGNMWCYPTSAFDFVHFMAKNGIPSLINIGDYDPGNQFINDPDPGFQHWGATWRVRQLVADMGTDDEKGTSGGGVSGLQKYLGARTSIPFNHYSRRWLDHSITPSYARDWMIANGLVILVFGRYDNIGGDWRIRQGGHVMALTGVEETITETGLSAPMDKAFSWRFRYVDPASEVNEDPRDLSLNSTMTNQWRALTPIKANWRAHDWSDFVGATRTLYRITTPKPNATTEGMVDGYHVVFPMIALTTTTKSASVTSLAKLKLNFGSGNAGSGTGKLESGGEGAESAKFGAPRSVDIEGPGSGNFADFIPATGLPLAFSLREGSDEVVRLNLGTMETDTIARVSGAERLAFDGRRGHLFVASSRTLTRIDIEDGSLLPVDISAPLVATFYDDVRGRLVVAAGSSLSYYDENLRLIGSSPMPALEGTSKLSLTVDPETGDYWLLRAGNPTAARLVFGSEGQYQQENVVLRDARNPRSLTIDNGGNLFVSEDGQMVQYTRRGERAETSPFNRMPAGEILHLTRDLIDPEAPGALHDAPTDE